jgi:putative restriction endonuclease
MSPASFIGADERLAQPVISHGLPLTKIHHVAFDAHLIGVDPDYRIHVSDRLLEIHDGPLKGIAGTLIDTPNRIEDRPVRDRLAIRFEQFKRPDTLDRTRGMR